MHAGKWKIFLVLTNIIGNRGWHKTCLTMLKHHLEHLWSFIIKWFQPFVGSWIVLKLYYSRAVHVTIFLSLSILFFLLVSKNKALFLTCSKIIQFWVVDWLGPVVLIPSSMLNQKTKYIGSICRSKLLFGQNAKLAKLSDIGFDEQLSHRRRTDRIKWSEPLNCTLTPDPKALSWIPVENKKHVFLCVHM